MATNIIIGGFAGATIGACLISLLGPGAAIPAVASLAAIGVNIGWKASQAAAVHKVADKGIEIIEKRSEEALRMADKYATASGQIVKRAADTCSKFTIAGYAAFGFVSLNRLVMTSAGKKCQNTPLAIDCLPSTAANIVTTVAIAAIGTKAIVKAYSIFTEEDEPLPSEKNAHVNQQPSSTFAANDCVCEDYTNIIGPNGQWIPVIESDPVKRGKEHNSRSYDIRDEVRVSNKSVCLNGENSFVYEAVYNFDYSKYGMEKIGRIWVDSKNERDIAMAKAKIKSKDKVCVIL